MNSGNFQPPPYDSSQPGQYPPPYSYPQPPSFYNQQTQMGPGQFQPPPHPPYNPYPQIDPKGNNRGFRECFHTRTRRVNIGLEYGLLIAVLMFCSCISTALGSGK